MLYKICGMRERENIAALAALPIHMIGLNFYPSSSRYVSEDVSTDIVEGCSGDIDLVGVFVNEEMKVVESLVDEFGLDYVQLHGGESVDYCKNISDKVGVIKVFSISDKFDFSDIEPFNFCDYFLFDTKSEKFGGSGNKFDWQVLSNYKGETPFLLAGGIGPSDAKEIIALEHPSFVGVDLNSQFESSPAVKEIEMIERFIINTKK